MTDAPSRAAALVVSRHGLVPPINPESLLRDEGCSVEFWDWPYECDALVTGLGTKHPQVFARQGMSRFRSRFTLAHELGHVLLGWHLNTVRCQVDLDARHDRFLGVDQETEANVFASHLLVPVSFRQHVTRVGMEVVDMLGELESAKVSAAAGLIAIKDHLPPGIVLRTDALTYPLVSAGTGQGIRDRVAGNEWSFLRQNATNHGRVRHQGRTVSWFDFWDDGSPAVVVGDDDRSPTDVLRGCLERAGVFGVDAADRMRSINGVAGFAFSSDRSSDRAQLTRTLRLRYLGHDSVAGIEDDPDFAVFLSKKVDAVVERRRAGSR